MFEAVWYLIPRVPAAIFAEIPMSGNDRDFRMRDYFSVCLKMRLELLLAMILRGARLLAYVHVYEVLLVLIDRAPGAKLVVFRRLLRLLVVHGRCLGILVLLDIRVCSLESRAGDFGVDHLDSLQVSCSFHELLPSLYGFE